MTHMKFLARVCRWKVCGSATFGKEYIRIHLLSTKLYDDIYAECAQT